MVNPAIRAIIRTAWTVDGPKSTIKGLRGNMPKRGIQQRLPLMGIATVGGEAIVTGAVVVMVAEVTAAMIPMEEVLRMADGAVMDKTTRSVVKLVTLQWSCHNRTRCFIQIHVDYLVGVRVGHQAEAASRGLRLRYRGKRCVYCKYEFWRFEKGRRTFRTIMDHCEFFPFVSSLNGLLSNESCLSSVFRLYKVSNFAEGLLSINCLPLNESQELQEPEGYLCC
ncbi:hypothetical protein RvY_02982-3 [Ramazzottius varieornatus]|uniref:Uncharacterized protein n=1 Tax=Ramazzottius varieornatus TaxID=947166 RepID=A0A1D1UW19_RAMVA|nr:hypothetical protein RvY_02982-3 [Ramazzottius varieornatus]